MLFHACPCQRAMLSWYHAMLLFTLPIYLADAHPLRQPRPQLPHHLIDAGHAAATCRGGRLRHQGAAWAAWAAWWLGAATRGGCWHNESRARCCEVMPCMLLQVHATAWHGKVLHKRAS